MPSPSPSPRRDRPHSRVVLPNDLLPASDQALLAIRGHAGAGPPSVGELAAALQLRHHSVVGLVDRLEEAGLVRRETDPGDNRRVLLRISPGGDAVLGKLTQAHLDEHARLREMLHREAPPSRPRPAG